MVSTTEVEQALYRLVRLERRWEDAKNDYVLVQQRIRERPSDEFIFLDVSISILRPSEEQFMQRWTKQLKNKCQGEVIDYTTISDHSGQARVKVPYRYQWDVGTLMKVTQVTRPPMAAL